MKETKHIPGLRLFCLEHSYMKYQQSIYRISYSVYDEAIRPLPQFYFYAWASHEHEALDKLNSYAEEENISYRSVAVGYTLALEELPETVEHDNLDTGIAIKRELPEPIIQEPVSVVAA